MKNRIQLLLIVILFNGLTSSAQTWLWGTEGSTGLKVDLTASNLATNKTGNVYQTGGFETSISFGAYSLNSPANEDFYLVKYDQNGNVLWATQSLGDFNSYALGYSVASDDADNSFITGMAYNYGGSEWDTIAFGANTIYVPERFLLIKYDPNGNVLWAKLPDTTAIPLGEVGYGVATDKFNHEYVAGGYNAFLTKFDRNGNTIWTAPQYTDSFGYSAGYDVTTDASGNVYESGIFMDTLIIGGHRLYSFEGAAFVAKFDSNGNVFWAQQSTNYGYYGDYGVYLAVNKTGAAYITGLLEGDSITFGSYTFSNDSTNSFFIFKFNPNGGIAWGEEANPINNGYCSSYSICSDDSNHIYISGEINSVATQTASFSLANDTIITIDTTSYDAPSFLIKLDSSGKILCASTLIAGAIEQNAITSDSTGKFVYIGGTFYEPFPIGNNNLTNSSGGYNSYVGRWQSCAGCNVAISIPSTSQSVCSGQSATLTASGFANYTWSPSSGLSATTGSSVVANPSINTVYTITGSDASGCSAMVSDTVLIIPAPNKPTITVSVTGDTLISSATSDNQWFFNDKPIPDSTRQVLIIKGHTHGWYYVVVTNPANGCTTISDSTTSINQLSPLSEQLSIYPNPTNSSVFVKINSLASNTNSWSLQLIDVLGQTLFTKASLNYNNEIDLSDLSTGVYFITIINKTGRVVFPVVKQ